MPAERDAAKGPQINANGMTIRQAIMPNSTTQTFLTGSDAIKLWGVTVGLPDRASALLDKPAVAPNPTNEKR